MAVCRFRGEKVFEVKNQLCGWRGVPEAVYRCPLHVICTHRKYRHGQTERVCLTCEDFEEQKQGKE